MASEAARLRGVLGPGAFRAVPALRLDEAMHLVRQQFQIHTTLTRR